MLITACLIAKDELPFLEISIPAAREVADQIVAVDMGSTDGSLEYLKEHCDKVRTLTQQDLLHQGYAACRNILLPISDGKWVYWFDADEMLSKENRPELRKMAEDGTPEHFWSLQCFTFNDSHFGLQEWDTIANNVPHEWGRHVRVHRNMGGMQWRGYIHEELFLGDQRAFEVCKLVDFKHLHYTRYRRWGNPEHKEWRASYMLREAHDKRDTLGKYMNPWWFNNWYPHNIPEIRRKAELYERHRDTIDPVH